MLSIKRLSVVADNAIIEDSLTISISHDANNVLKKPDARTLWAAFKASQGRHR